MMSQVCLIIIILCILGTYTQWIKMSTINTPLPRRGHSLVTYINDNNEETVIMFGGRTQKLEECRYNNNWTYSLCGDHFYQKLTDTTIVESNDCALNCSENGWCHYEQTINGSYCVCFDEYRGDTCEYKEFQDFSNDVYYLNITTFEWNKYSFDNINNYAYADDWPWISHRYKHSAIINNDTMIVFGGYSPKCLDYCSDVWIWDISNNNDNNKWNRLIRHLDHDYRTNYTIERWFHSSFLYDNEMYIFGGQRRDGEFMNDIHKLNINNYTGNWAYINKSNNIILPSIRVGFGFTKYNNDNNTDNIGFIHGGLYSDYTKNDTYTDDVTWERDLWRYTIIDNNDVIWDNMSYLNIIETDPIDEIQTELNRWYKIPYPRMNHLLFHAPNSDILFLFGGSNQNEWFNETWRYNISTNIWTKHEPPLWDTINLTMNCMAGSAWTYIPSLNSLLLHGGYGSNNKNLSFTTHLTYYNDTYIMNFNQCNGYPNSCSNNGKCHYQYCICNSTHFGDACQYDMCPGSSCTYDPITWIPTCTHCNNKGTCNNGVCECISGYSGDGCQSLNCTNDCSGYGVCTEISFGDVQCICDDDHQGSDCGTMRCPNDCSSRGTCDTSTGICTCYQPPETGRKYRDPDCGYIILA